MILLVGVAMAAPLTHGERLEWAVSWMGIEAGSAWSTVARNGEAWVVEAGARNAGWLDHLYPIEDWMRSTWQGAGSQRYETRFREGRFHQDQDMRLGPPEILVHRGQDGDQGWHEWESRYRHVPGAEDPISAVFRLRVAPPPVGGSIDFPVFNGKKTLTLRATGAVGAPVDGVATREVQVRSASDGDYDGQVTLLLSEDDDRVPLRAFVGTRAGTVTIALARRSVP